jgi:XTP/dITP diphosphohydrolase
MNQLVFGTSNIHKFEELQAIIPKSIILKSMEDFGLNEELPETHSTIPGNAMEKAQALHDRLNTNVFAEDTGLEVDALNGDPGVFTARYAGPERSAKKNMDLLLENLKTKSDRSAQFRTVIAMFWKNRPYTFEGIVRGTIADKELGNGGFGYDPVFIPEGFSKTFAQLDESIKNEISHRARAVKKMIEFLAAHT